MAHEIGQMFWHGDVPWHGLGKKLDRPATLEEAMKHGGLDWNVSLVPLVTYEATSNTVSQRCAVVRDDVPPGEPGRVLGVVHPAFQPLQNRDGAELFHRLLDLGDRRYHTGGYLGSGEVVWLLARLPQTIVVAENDAVETYLLYTNSHDGSIAIDIRLTTVRVVCRNTLSMALHANSSRAFRRAHRSSAAMIERDAKAFFQATRDRIEETQALFRRLAERRCDDATFERFVGDLLPDPRAPMADAGSVAAKAHATRLAALAMCRADLTRIRREGLAERDLPPDPPTWWGAVNAVTGWVDHLQPVKGERYAYLMFGSGDWIKQRAVRLAVAAAG
jgi:phage/plasmid-like protein (TIGR03299 family)